MSAFYGFSANANAVSLFAVISTVDFAVLFGYCNTAWIALLLFDA